MKQLEIVVNNRKMLCVFGLGFIGECLENLDLSVFEIGEKLDKNPFKWTPILIHESIKYAEDGEIDFTVKELVEWLDNDGEAGTKTIADFLAAFVKSLSKDVPKDENEPPTKEKSPKKK